MDKAREIALKTLYKIEKEESYSNIELSEQINTNRNNLTEKDIGLISEIVYGVTTWRLTLDEIIKKHSNIKLKKISIWIKNILRMGIYQIIFLEKIPKSAAVNEAVELAKRYGHKASSNFVNAILRKVEKNDYDEMFKIENDVERISKTNSMPEWIVKKLIEQRSIEDVENICKNSNTKLKNSIRINKLKTDKIELYKILQNEKISFCDAILEDFVYLNNVKNIEKKESFKNGLYSIQDEIAGLPSIIIDPQQEEKILDACSAPGGKTTYIAEIIKDNGIIEAWDIHEHRIKLIEENAKRLGINSIKTYVKDATIYEEKYYEKFDKILLDVPCLGTGVIRKKPDIKWRKNEGDIKEINKIQYKILNTCSKYLKKDGIIIYSTCSILREENEQIIEVFLKENKDFQIEYIKTTNNSFFDKYINKNGFLDIIPNDKSNGFFIVKIKKK